MSFPWKKNADQSLETLKNNLFKPLSLSFEKIEIDTESQEYHASRFILNNSRILYRKAKITPKKIGLFVSLWKRINKKICPYDICDQIDFIMIATNALDNQTGCFIFPKSLLVEKKILSTPSQKGKMAIRIYPPWDIPISSQACQTQKWQNPYFLDFSASFQIDFKKAEKLLSCQE